MEEAIQRTSLPRHRLPRNRWIRLLAIALLAFACAATHARQSAAVHPRTEEPRRFVVEKPLAPGGQLHLVINQGDVRIVRNQRPAEIRLEVEILNHQIDPVEAERRWLKSMDVEGRQAAIHLELPAGRSSGRVTIYLPAVTALVARMHAGILTVGGVQGDKDLGVGSGTLTLREGDPSAYKTVKADVRIGELTDGVFHGRQSGVWGRALVAEGKGQYRLLLHVGTGNLLLTGEDGGL